MAEYIIQEETLVGIADAIRSKTGESNPVAVTDMAEKISGIAADEKVETTVTLDFSEGDMEVVPEDGTAFSSVSIPTPTTLIPENIAEGVNIAGIIGTLAAGGVSAKINIFTIPYSASGRTVNHNLGVVPDMIFLLPSSTTNGSTAGTRYLAAFGVSAKFAQEYSVPVYGSNVYYGSNKWYTKTYTTPIDQATSSSNNFIYNANANSFYLSSYNVGMVCIAIGGLT